MKGPRGDPGRGGAGSRPSPPRTRYLLIDTHGVPYTVLVAEPGGATVTPEPWDSDTMVTPGIGDTDRRATPGTQSPRGTQSPTTGTQNPTMGTQNPMGTHNPTVATTAMPPGTRDATTMMMPTLGTRDTNAMTTTGTTTPGTHNLTMTTPPGTHDATTMMTMTLGTRDALTVAPMSPSPRPRRCPFSCVVCGRSFAFLSYLRRHSISHSPLKPHVCRACGKGFKRPSHLERHRRTHRPRGCPRCHRRGHREAGGGGEGAPGCTRCPMRVGEGEAAKRRRRRGGKGAGL